MIEWNPCKGSLLLLLLLLCVFSIRSLSPGFYLRLTRFLPNTHFFPFISRDVSKWKPLLSFPRSDWRYGFASVFFTLTYSKAQLFCLPPSSLDQECKDILIIIIIRRIIMYIYNKLIDALGDCRKHLAENKNVLYTSTLYRYIKYNQCKPVPHTLH